MTIGVPDIEAAFANRAPRPQRSAADRVFDITRGAGPETEADVETVRALLPQLSEKDQSSALFDAARGQKYALCAMLVRAVPVRVLDFERGDDNIRAIDHMLYNQENAPAGAWESLSIAGANRLRRAEALAPKAP